MNNVQEKALVRIILPAYNQGKYVTATIASLKKQTFQDFEVVLLDDGSNDGFTPKVLAELDYDKIIAKHLFTDNVGAAKRYNPFIKEAQNKYVLLLCGDDFIAPTFLEECVAFLEKQPEYAAVATDAYLFFQDTKKYQLFEYYEDLIGLPQFLVDARYTGSCLMRKEALEQFPLPELERKSDFNRWIYFLENGWKLGVIKQPLFYYRQLPSSQMATLTLEMDLAVKEQTYELHRASFEKYAKDVYLYFVKTTWQKNLLYNNTEYLNDVLNSWSYKIGRFLTFPLRFLRDTIKNLLYKIKG